MLQGAGVVPSIFNLDELDANTANELLTTGREVLRMLQEGDDTSDDAGAREVYQTYFRI